MIYEMWGYDESENKIIQATDTIQAELPDGRLIEGPRGGTVEQFLEPIISELK